MDLGVDPSLSSKELLQRQLFTKISKNHCCSSNCGKERYVCWPCGDVYCLKSSYNFHLNRASVLIEFSCHSCNKKLTFKNKCMMMKHIALHKDTSHDLGVFNVSNLSTNYNEELNTYLNICNESASAEFLDDEHLPSNTEVSINNPDTNSVITIYPSIQVNIPSVFKHTDSNVINNEIPERFASYVANNDIPEGLNNNIANDVINNNLFQISGSNYPRDVLIEHDEKNSRVPISSIENDKINHVGNLSHNGNHLQMTESIILKKLNNSSIANMAEDTLIKSIDTQMVENDECLLFNTEVSIDNNIVINNGNTNSISTIYPSIQVNIPSVFKHTDSNVINNEVSERFESYIANNDIPECLNNNVVNDVIDNNLLQIAGSNYSRDVLIKHDKNKHRVLISPIENDKINHVDDLSHNGTHLQMTESIILKELNNSSIANIAEDTPIKNKDTQMVENDECLLFNAEVSINNNTVINNVNTNTNTISKIYPSIQVNIPSVSKHFECNVINNEVPKHCESYVANNSIDNDLLSIEDSNHSKDVNYKYFLRCPICFLKISGNLAEVRQLRLLHFEEKSNKEYECINCFITIKNECSYRAHLKQHAFEKQYFCFRCGFQTLTSAQIQTHMEACIFNCKNRQIKCLISGCNGLFQVLPYITHFIHRHTNKMFKCSNCSYTTSSSPILGRDLEHCQNLEFTNIKQHYLKCHACKKTIDKNSMELHITQHVNKVAKFYLCTGCQKSFKRISYLKNHILACEMYWINDIFNDSNAIIENNKPVDCKPIENQKESRFKDKNVAAQFLSKYPYRCCKCLFISNIAESFEEHIKSHKLYKYKCADCLKEFLNLGPFTLHLIKNHNIFNIEDYIIENKCRVPTDQDEEGSREFISAPIQDAEINPVCNMSHNSNYSQMTESVVLENLKNNSSRKDPKNMKPVNYNNKSLLHDEQKTEKLSTDSSKKCAVCLYECKSKETYITHILSHRLRSAPYQCVNCGLSFKSKLSFSIHLLKIHKIGDVDDYIMKNKRCKLKSKKRIQK